MRRKVFVSEQLSSAFGVFVAHTAMNCTQLNHAGYGLGADVHDRSRFGRLLLNSTTGVLHRPRRGVGGGKGVRVFLTMWRHFLLMT